MLIYLLNKFIIIIIIIIITFWGLFIYILNTSSLSAIWSANIFSQCMTCLFILIMVSFEEKLIILMKSNLLFSFIDHAFGIVSKKLLPNPRWQRFSPVFPSWSGIVTGLTFKSTIYIQSVFVYSLRYRSKFLFFFCIWMVYCSTPFAGN